MMVSLFVLTVSHVRPFQRRPGLWIVVFLFGTAVACIQIIKYISDYFKLTVSLRIGMLDESGGGLPLNLTTAIVMVGLSVALFFITNWMLSRKISLK